MSRILLAQEIIRPYKIKKGDKGFEFRIFHNEFELRFKLIQDSN
jgi:hypothetical protein